MTASPDRRSNGFVERTPRIPIAAAPKSRAVHGPAWMEDTRPRWAALTNRVLGERGRDERVDHRSYARQGIDREPGSHFGPAAA
ncbi:MAG: MobA/MobL family protein, partial [Vicinamibacterales bacterium]